MKLQHVTHFLVVVVMLCGSVSAQHHHHDMKSGGISDPKVHPFADPGEGREGYRLSNAPVNELRLYDFYQRQADHYMSMSKGAARMLPAYPGLDAGLHGHWGKFNQNNHSDDGWNQQAGNNLIGACLHVKKVKVHKAINLLLGDNGELGACFDPWTMSYRYVWSGGFVKYDGYRWGTSRGVRMQGKLQFTHSGSWRNGNSPNERMKDAAFHGVYRHGQRSAFSYRIGTLEVLDAPWAISRDGNSFMTRRLKLTSSTDSEHTLPLLDLPSGTKRTSTEHSEADNWSVTTFENDGKCWAIACTSAAQVVVNTEREKLSVSLQFKGPVNEEIDVAVGYGDIKHKKVVVNSLTSLRMESPRMSSFKSGGPSQWPETLTLKGERSDVDDAYVVDSIPVPFENPYHSVMMFSGIDFLPNGDAFVATVAGDIWKVSGIDDHLQHVTWKRFAAGLHQPFGIKIQGDDIFVLCKDRMQLLRDFNDDGEADYYENYDNSWVETHGHTHVFGNDRDREGNFYFPVYDGFYKLPPDGSGVKLIAKGFRNCMGVAVSDDGLVLAAPQEGTWTPASMIIEVREGEHYGFQRSDESINSPMCFIPRGIDNSTGGMVFVNSERWGPLGQSLIGLSYGNGTHYLILRDESVPRAQGATVPLKGEFTSGVVRGRINPRDGQLYVVGTQGWGNYAMEDGCMNRIRYTGKPVYKPIGFQVHSNGIRIDFTEPLDPESSREVKRYFAQQWNYEHSKGYGSVEYSVFRPMMIGHDRVAIKSVQILNDGKSLFLEIPRIVPCYQFHVRMHLVAADGTGFETDIFPTILSLGDRYEFSGAKPDVPNRAQKLKLRIREQSKIVLKGHNPKLKTKRTLTLKAIPGIQYDKKTLVARAGEAIELKLVNADGMPHNLVLVQPGAYEKVGRLSFKMLNDPSAFDNQYVPDVPEVITHTAVVFPAESTSTKFVVPDAPGAYPFLCTFPGHWQSMYGQLVVVDKNQPLPDPKSLTPQLVTLADQLLREDVSKLAADARKLGDARNGAALFYNTRVSCANCHAPKEGQLIGPKLTARHDQTTDEYLVESVLHPSKDILKGYETATVLTFDGRMRTGVRVSEDEDNITLRDLANDGQLLKYRKEDLDDVMHSKTSSMPTGLVNNLQSRQQFLDLMRFLFTVSEGGEKALNELSSSVDLGH